MKILVRIPNWLGDAVMATPALQILKKKYPNALITILGAAYLKELFADYDYVIDDTKEASNRVLATYQLAKRLGKFDLAITMQNTLLSALLLFWTSSTKRVGFRKNIRGLFLTDAIFYDSNIHQTLRYAALSGASVCNEPLYLNVQKKIFTNKTVAVAPGAAYGKTKRWQAFDECLVLLLKRHQFEVIILGASSDKAVCDLLESALCQNGVVCQNLAGRTSLVELAQIIASVSLFLTNDSGPMHIAAALHTPTIAIFGSTNPDITGPWMSNECVVVYDKLECSPCFKRECKYMTYECLAQITPQRIANLASGVLSEA